MTKVKCSMVACIHNQDKICQRENIELLFRMGCKIPKLGEMVFLECYELKLRGAKRDESPIEIRSE